MADDLISNIDDLWYKIGMFWTDGLWLMIDESFHDFVFWYQIISQIYI